MFVNATNQLTRRSHIQFKAFTHENKTRKRNVIVYYYDEDDIMIANLSRIFAYVLIDAAILLEYEGN